VKSVTNDKNKGTMDVPLDGPQSIVVVGAAEHNLRHIDCEIPKNKFTVVTGVSGSGKSSLVFDTIFAEGQRRFIESLSAYARQFLGMLEKPKVDFMSGLSPSISIDQKSVSRNPRSTVGTITEIYDYLRLLYARVGVPHCPKCRKVIEPQTSQQMVDRVLMLDEGTHIMILAPIVRGRKGEYRKEFRDLIKKGFIRAKVDGELMELEEGMSLDRYFEHTIEVVVDRLRVKSSERARISEAIETSLNMADGVVAIEKGVCLRRLRYQSSRDGATYLLLEHTSRCMYELYWSRGGERVRSRPLHQRPQPVPQSGCHDP
jgi:excinuclease ABC subunit A